METALTPEKASSRPRAPGASPGARVSGSFMCACGHRAESQLMLNAHMFSCGKCTQD